MKTSFNVTGSDRKRLVSVISKSTGESVKYLGAPTMAYEVGPFTVSRDGTLEFSDCIDSGVVEKMYEDISAAGFDFEAPELPVSEAEGEPAGFGLSVIFPADTLDDDAIRNLETIIAAKGSLIRKALGTDELRIDRTEKMVSFPWFNEQMLTTEEAKAYTHFISAL